MAMHPIFTDIKNLELEISGLLTRFEERDRDEIDHRAASIAKTHFETACMWLTRSLFQKGEER